MKTLLLSVCWALAAAAQQNITLTKEVPGGVVNLGTVATPTLNNDTGTYNNDVAVTFLDATSGATLYTCVNAGSDCTPAYVTTNPVTVTADGVHACAVARKVDYTDSAAKCATYTLTAATPTDSPGAGTYGSTQSVTLTSGTTGASIRYTVDGSTPACPSTGTLYSGAISVSTTTTVKAIACKTGYNSSGVLSSTYTVVTGASDTFTGATADLNTHTSDSGHTWTKWDSTRLNIDGSGNAVWATDGVNYYGGVYSSSFSPGSANYTVTANTTSVSGGILLIGRLTDVNHYYEAGWYAAAAEWRINILNGTYAYSVLNSINGSAPVDGDVISFVLSGTSLTVKKNGTTVLTATDSTLATAGKCGMHLYSGASVTSWGCQ